MLEAIRGLRQWCETLSEQLAAMRWRQLGPSFDTPRAAYRAIKQWGDEECTRIEEESLAKRKRGMMHNGAVPAYGGVP